MKYVINFKDVIGNAMSIILEGPAAEEKTEIRKTLIAQAGEVWLLECQKREIPRLPCQAEICSLRDSPFQLLAYRIDPRVNPSNPYIYMADDKATAYPGAECFKVGGHDCHPDAEEKECPKYCHRNSEIECVILPTGGAIFTTRKGGWVTSFQAFPEFTVERYEAFFEGVFGESIPPLADLYFYKEERAEAFQANTPAGNFLMHLIENA